MLEQMALAVRNGGKTDNSLEWFRFEIITAYVAKVSTYNEVEKNVYGILGLSMLADPMFWQDQIKQFEPATAYDAWQKMRRANEVIVPILNLLDRDYENITKNESFPGQDVQVQTVILTDEGGHLSSPIRIVELITAVEQIYAVIAEADGVRDAALAIVGMDSGSEKSLDFLGLARLMHELRETVQMVYNMITFHKQNVTIRNLQVAGETLAVVGKIAKLENAKSISEEDAKRMKQRLFAGLEKFAATGAYTREMNMPHLPPALAMQPQPRMLTGPAENIVRQANDAVSLGSEEPAEPAKEITPANQEFSASELEAAVRLLRAAKDSGSEDDKSSDAPVASPPRKPRRRKPAT